MEISDKDRRRERFNRRKRKDAKRNRNITRKHERQLDRDDFYAHMDGDRLEDK
jgi:hypothetical protein